MSKERLKDKEYIIYASPRGYGKTYYELEKLRKENKQLKEVLDEIREYCEFGIKEWITDDGFVEEVLKDILDKVKEL